MNIFEYWPALAAGLGATITITLSAFAIGAVLAVPVTVLRRSRFAVLRTIAGTYVEFLRGMPPLAWLFIIFFGLPQFGIVLQPLQAAIYVFGIIASAYLAEIYRAGLRAVPRGQTEASTALGLGLVDTYARVVAPQALRTVVPLAISYLIGLIKDSAAASVIGVLEVTGRAAAEARLAPSSLTTFVSAAALYLVLSIPVGLLGRWISARSAMAMARG